MAVSSIIPESQLVFSAELAATLGLEEAVLVQQLRGLYQHLPATPMRGLSWLHVSHAYLQQLLPFWSREDLTRITRSLEAQGLLQVDHGNASGDSLLFALIASGGANAPAPAMPAARPPSRPQRETPRPRGGEGHPLPPDFTPNEDMLEILETFHSVPRDFALQQVEDFMLYWRERGSAGHAWQNKFKQHVLFHWARYQQSQGAAGSAHDKEQRGAGAAGRTRDRSLEQDLTDTSWAE